MKRILSFVALALVAALTVAGCGGGNSSKDTTGTSFNGADVGFAQSMIPHHRQAIEMARLAQTHASTPVVKQFAAKIEAAQGPEIETMTGWLKDWGKKVPTQDMGGTGGMSHAEKSMPGMMSAADMKKLDAANGPVFDQMFVTMMMSHHRGAIEMARSEQKNGQDSNAVTLAKKIEAAQTGEIADMQNLLKG